MKKITLFVFTSTLLFFQFACNLNPGEQGNNQDEPIGELASETQEPEAKPKPVDPTLAYGIDISQFQGNEIEFLDKQKDQLAFVICKATEGITYTDPDFKQNWTVIPQKGFIRGAYHFYRTKDNPSLQAKNYINAINDLGKNDLPPIVDLEGGGIDKSQSVELVQRSLLAFLEEVENELKRTPMIYTDPATGNKYLNNSVFATYPLWVADYTESMTPTVPHAWENGKWMIWQKTSDYLIDGKKNDYDQFNGSITDLVDFIKKTNL